MSSPALMPSIDALKKWLETPLGRTVQNYSLADTPIFPCHGITESLQCTCGKKDCGNAGKHPFCSNGLLDATVDIVKLAELFRYRNDLNVGMPTGIKNVVLDIDGNKFGFESLAKLENEYEPLPDTPISITGNGQHRFFEVPKEKIKSRANALGKEYHGIDIRSQGGYVIVPNSKHVSRKNYTWMPDTVEDAPPMPQWLIDLLKDKPKAASNVAQDFQHSSRHSEWSVEEVWEMLDSLDADMGRDDWIRVCFALREGGFPYSMFDSWSSRSKKPNNYSPFECNKAWKSSEPTGGTTMGTLVHMARDSGKYYPKQKERLKLDIDTGAVDSLIEQIEFGSIHAMPEFKFNFDPLKLPGLLGDTIRWITKYALQPQPELALLNILAFAGAIFGRRYASPLNTRTNLYVVGIASTGAGKDFSRQCIKDLSAAAGLDSFVGSDYIRSDIGLLIELQNNPCQVLQIDEFGMYLEAVNNAKAPTHFRNISQIITKVYGSSSTSYKHGGTADKTQGKLDIVQPNLSIFGTTTEKKYVKAFSGESIESGEINRFICYKSTHEPTGDEDDPLPLVMDEDVISGWKALCPLGSGANPILGLANIKVDPITVSWDEECRLLQRSYRKKQVMMSKSDEKTGELWVRLRENTIKIAMIFAIARNPQYPRFEKADFETAFNIVETCIKYMAYLAHDLMSESKYEAEQQKMKSYLKRRAKVGATLTDIGNKFRSLRGREKREILEDMEDQDLITVTPTKIGAKTVNVYRIK